jgi:pilus assembly protein Flp/PilA
MMLEQLRSIATRREEDGASAVEYGLLVAGIAALVVAIIFIFGNVVNKNFNNACGRLSAGASASSASTCS